MSPSVTASGGSRSHRLGEAALALVPPRGEYQPGHMTGVALESSDPRADHAELKEKDVVQASDRRET